MAQQDPLMPSRVDFAWRCHAAQESWTAKVDAKASIFLTANFVGLAALLAARSNPGEVVPPSGWQRFGLDTGIVLAGLATLATIVVIFPLLGPSRVAQPGAIYFGHLRGRSPDAVARQISVLGFEDQLGQLARQLVVMSRVNWMKHRVLQVAIVLAVVGYTLAGLSFST